MQQHLQKMVRPRSQFFKQVKAIKKKCNSSFLSNQITPTSPFFGQVKASLIQVYENMRWLFTVLFYTLYKVSKDNTVKSNVFMLLYNCTKCFRVKLTVHIYILQVNIQCCTIYCKVDYSYYIYNYCTCSALLYLHMLVPKFRHSIIAPFKWYIV